MWRTYTEQELIERVMTLHWDIGACPCEVCVYGRERDWWAREQYLHGHDHPTVTGEEFDQNHDSNKEK